MTAAADGSALSPSAHAGARPRVVIADDHEYFRALLRAIVHQAGMEVFDADCGERLLSLVAREQPDAIVIDWLMPGGGLALVHELISRHGMDGRVVMLSGLDDRRDVLSAVRAGVARYFVKPPDAEELLAALHEIAAGYPAASPSAAEPQATGAGPSSSSRTRAANDDSVNGLAMKPVAARLVNAPRSSSGRPEV